ncbi:hypothetical protein DFS34DRAFT_459747 [Phlyctochytrium arcticum]|nr:hypothetical protein DFS34DRAFT_459747 [Phlyctochytrium arcticum]
MENRCLPLLHTFCQTLACLLTSELSPTFYETTFSLWRFPGRFACWRRTFSGLLLLKYFPTFSWETSYRKNLLVELTSTNSRDESPPTDVLLVLPAETAILSWQFAQDPWQLSRGPRRSRSDFVDSSGPLQEPLTKFNSAHVGVVWVNKRWKERPLRQQDIYQMIFLYRWRPGWGLLTTYPLILGKIPLSSTHNIWIK